jgi:hypothetical protein
MIISLYDIYANSIDLLLYLLLFQSTPLNFVGDYSSACSLLTRVP